MGRLSTAVNIGVHAFALCVMVMVALSIVLAGLGAASALLGLFV
jgi:hypothetical protein